MIEIQAVQFSTRASARAAGAITYFTGKPCKNGHVSGRYTASANCVSCQIIREAARFKVKSAAKKKSGVSLRPRAKAIASGEKTYSTGKPCIAGHISERDTTSGLCLICRRLRDKRLRSLGFGRNKFERRALVKWADLSKIKAIYSERDTRNAQGSIRWNVDHIVPLRSKLVCGLHNEHNLAVIPSIDNSRKSNKYWPDMPEIA